MPPRPGFLSDAAMVFLRTSGLAALLCVLYIVFANERGGFILLGALSLAALAAGVTVVLAYRDEAVVVEVAPEGPPVARPVRQRSLPAPSATPVAGAAAAALVAAGALYGPSLIIAGVVLGLITVFALAAVLTGEHRGKVVNLLPLAIPIVAFAVIGSFMFLMSRILLAVNADLSTGVAILVAILILAGGFLVANKPSVPTRTLVRATAGLAVLFAAGGFAAYGVGQRPEERKAGPEPVAVIAKNIAYEQKHLHFEAGTAVTVDFKNEDTVPHNIDFTADQGGTETFYKKDPLPGPISDTYKFTAPKAGEYFYHCDVHPNMTGTVSVTGAGGPEPSQVTAPTTIAGKSGGPATTEARASTSTTKAAPAGGGGGGGAPTSADLVAKGIAFSPTTLTLAANTPVVIHFDNREPLPHNVDITTQEGGGTTIFKQDPFTGPQKVDYKFTTPGPGRLYFVCDVHPNMKGTINVR
jgi:plastocyanin